jgi:regulator of protease activity HflC (stomatin/prohibitin superfamily)
MRTVLEILLLLVLAALSIWAGLPWPIVFVVALLLACGLRLFSFTKGAKVDPGLFFALAAFFGLGLLISWLLRYTVFSDNAGQIVSVVSGDPSNTVFSSTLASLIFGFIVAAVFYIPLLLPVSFIGARIVYGAYGQYKGHELEAMFSLIRSVLGMNKGTLLVKGGMVQAISGQEKSLARFGGPATLIVQEGHAVILEKPGALSRVVGKGTDQLGKFERVSAVVELTSNSQSLEEENVVTKDGVSLDRVQAIVFYKVVPGDPNKSGYHENGQYPFNEDVVYKFWSTTGEQTWQNSVKAIAKAVLRDVIATVEVDKIFTNADEFRRKMKGDKGLEPTTAEFRGDLCNYINRITEPLLGIRITTADIGGIELPEDARRQLMEKWMAEVERKTIIARSQAAATALSVQEMARAEAQKRMIGMISEAITKAGSSGQPEAAEQIVRLRLIEALEKMATEHASGLFLPSEMLAWLRSGQVGGGESSVGGGTNTGPGGASQQDASAEKKKPDDQAGRA